MVRVRLTIRSELEHLRLRMEAAAAAMDFEEAGRLRDQLSLLQGQPDASPRDDIDTSRLRRQQPGAMGLGTRAVHDHVASYPQAAK